MRDGRVKSVTDRDGQQQQRGFPLALLQPRGACEQRQAAKRPGPIPLQPAGSQQHCPPAPLLLQEGLRSCGDAGEAGLVSGHRQAEPHSALPGACMERGACGTWGVLPLSERGDSAGVAFAQSDQDKEKQLGSQSGIQAGLLPETRHQGFCAGEFCQCLCI